MAAEQWDRDYAFSTLEGNDINTRFVGDELLHEGYVTTRYGYVYVWARTWNGYEKTTRLQFIRSGRQYSRYIADIYQPRYLVTLARRFAAEIVGQEE